MRLEQTSSEKSIWQKFFSFWLFCIAAVAVSLIYAHVRGHGFVYDDEYLIVKNPYLKDWKNLLLFFTHDVTEMSGVHVASGYYRPASMILLQVLFHLFGLTAWKYHFFNLAVHSLNSFLAGVLIHRIGASRFIAAFTTLIFAVHPIHVESVSLICAYMGLVSSFMVLTSMLLFLKYRRMGKSTWMLFALACYSLAIGFKEDAIVLPGFFLLTDWILFRKKSREILTQSVLEMLPFFCVAAIYLMARGVFVERGAAFGFWHQAEQLNFLNPGGFSGWLGVLFLVFKNYFSIWIWPHPLTVFHFLNFPTDTLNWMTLCGEWFLLSLVLIQSSKNYLFLWGWTWFFCFSFLISNVIPIGGMFAERLIYLPSVGFAFLTAAFAEKLWKFFPRLRLFQSLLRIGLLGIICLGSFQAYAYSVTWKSNFSIWWNAAEVTPYQSYPYFQLARAFASGNNWHGAARLYKKAVVLTGKDVQNTSLRRSAAQAFGAAGEYDLAVREYKDLLQRDPYSWGGYFDLGWTYFLKGDLDSADIMFHTLLHKNPGWAWAYYGLAEVETKRGHYEAGRKLYMEALNHASDKEIVKTILKKFQERSKS